MSVSEQIVNKVAESEDKEPTTLPPLYETVDPDAINTLIEPQSVDTRQKSCEVRFEYFGYDIIVDRMGEITLIPHGGTKSELGD